jgi:glycosyltransferase involved in cell wall biosynthesis
MHVLRYVDRQRFQMDFVVNTDRRCDFNAEIESLGSRIFPCLNPSKPLRYARNLFKILREHGPYDVVHSHVHHYSGLVLFVARRAGVPHLVAHSHSDTSLADSRSSSLRRLYLRGTQHLIHQNASMQLAASGLAAKSLFGASSGDPSKTSLLYCGIDLKPFETQVDRNALRQSLGLAPDDFVVGHVGRFVPEKNHELLLRIHAEILKIKPAAKLLLVGKGPLEQQIRTSAQALGIPDSIRFAGLREDVPRIMLSAIDVFVLPSLWEGLPIVVIEAQAAGLPTVLSASVSPEAEISSGLVRFVSPQAPPHDWALAILDQCAIASKIGREKALQIVKQSPFSIDRSAQSLCALYEHLAHPQASAPQEVHSL